MMVPDPPVLERPVPRFAPAVALVAAEAAQLSGPSDR
jgi:hypothetical protein